MLRDFGNEVDMYFRDNRTLGATSSFNAALNAVWSREVYQEIRRLLKSKRYDVLHVQNFFPIISPAIYYAARAEGVSVVQTLRNYRLLCPNALLHRDHRVCEDCIGKIVPWPALVHACYRSSYSASAATVAMISLHRVFGTWNEKVNVYIALTEFARGKFIDGGLPENKILIKPNTVHPDPGAGDGTGGFGLYVGRLSPEKGIDTLIQAWGKLGGRATLKVAGDGPLAPEVARAASRHSGIEWLGRQSSQEVQKLMKSAAFLLFPSKVYEGFPRAIVESFAAGTPVIASNHGAMAHLIDDHDDGLLFRPADADDLAEKVRWAFANSQKLNEMRGAARATYELKYSAGRNVRLLLDIYDKARKAA
jgi:glycosyltransferase involved in cell wall biosynthesis